MGAIGGIRHHSFTNAWFNGYDIEGRDSGDTSYCHNSHSTVWKRVDLSSKFKQTEIYGCYFALIGPGIYWSYPDFSWATGEAAYYRDAGSVKHVITTTTEKQNFANWYSYYRTRNYAARAGVASAFVTLGSNIRVGWGSINQGANYVNGYVTSFSPTLVDGKSVHAVKEGVRTFDDARKKKFLQWLYKDARPLANTPLRHALDGAGQYYDRSGGGGLGPWADDPAHPGASELSAACRKSFTILMTDGYWNQGMNPAGTTAATVNTDGATFTPPLKADGSAGSGAITSTSPFKDSYSNTLADVAWYYWARDLLPGYTNNKVPSNSNARDQAWWQHMTTFTIGLGAIPTTANKISAFNAISTGSAPGFLWPSTDANENKIDDLLHAGVNGHGDSFSAMDPQEFATSMQAIINAIGDSAGCSGKLGTNEATQGASGASAARVFNSSYQTDKWRGDLASRPVSVITETNLTPLGASEWSAAAKLPAPGARRIFTRSDSSGITFNWTSLNTAQKTALAEGNADPYGSDMLTFLRGDKAKEVANGGSFRNRYRDPSSASPLGDSPHNTPHYHAATKTVYQGANDGMLHAFDAETGVERFAYIPSALFPRLPLLAHTDYNHAFYVDGEAVVANSADGSHHMLVGALGRGGKGLYGLDVTNPTSFSTGDIKWEFNAPASCAAADPDDIKDLGLILGKPITAKLSGSGNKVVIVGNGYNSCSGKAALYFIDTVTGHVAQKVVVNGGPDNGLSTPFAYDANNDGIPDAIYAGDLNGNLWRFEANSAGTWSARFGGSAVPMVVARNPDNQIQPITAAPFAVKNETDGKLWVFFGTGQFLQSTDKGTQQVQSLYGLIDDGGSTITHTDLKQRTIVSSTNTGTLSDGNTGTVRFLEQAELNDMVAKRGWYVDFDLDTDKGERIISPVVAVKAGSAGIVLEAFGVVPTTDPCEPGGYSHWERFDAFSGGALTVAIIDTNGDGKVDGGDRRTITVGGKQYAEFDISIKGIATESTLGKGPDCPMTVTTCPEKGECESTLFAPPGCGSRGIKGRVAWRELIN
ncbi:type IV pilus biogenesis factor PilY1 [Betaproteobacteria bacterium]|nr:type IV pilus biogenesis factor PilY1 [Betaproteobacteria bacterium]